jgi:plasmid maintenance system antidote protein VapI
MAALVFDTVWILRCDTDMSARRTPGVDLAARIRRAIRESDLTPYRIATDADVDRAIMTRFVNGERGLTLTTASRICEVLGLELRPARRTRKGG